MTIPQEAVEAAARVMKPRQFEPNYTPLGMWSDLEQMHEIAELDRDMTRDRVRDILTAAEPHLRKKLAEEVQEKVNPPDVDYSHEWRRGFTVGAIKAARFVEGAGNE